MKTIEQIKKTPLSERSVQEEYRLAKHEKRQPRCVYCKELLEIEQPLFAYIEWAWNERKKCYERYDMEERVDKRKARSDRIPGALWYSMEEDDGKPRCSTCYVADWDFIDEDLARY